MWEIDDLIMHRAPMSLLNRVVEEGDDHLIAEVDVREDSLFFESGRGVPAWVGMEYMAQAVAALAGFRARRAGQPPMVGLLIGCREYRSLTPVFTAGSCLSVQIRELTSNGEGLSAFACTISDNKSGDDEAGSRSLVESQLTVYERHDGS